MNRSPCKCIFGIWVGFALFCISLFGPSSDLLAVEAQPLAANVRRVQQTLEFLGAPLPEAASANLRAALAQEDSEEIQSILDQQVLFLVDINPEVRVKVRRGPGSTVLQQAGYTPVLVKIINLGTTTQQLRISSQQAGQVYGGMSSLSASRMQRTELNEL
jgi:hypothetical protein